MADDTVFARNNAELPKCPDCGGYNTGKAGRTVSGKQRYRCRDVSCRRYFVVDPGVPKAVKVVVDRMAAEGIAPAVIARVVRGGCSKRWVYARVRGANGDR